MCNLSSKYLQRGSVTSRKNTPFLIPLQRVFFAIYVTALEPVTGRGHESLVSRVLLGRSPPGSGNTVRPASFFSPSLELFLVPMGFERGCDKLLRIVIPFPVTLGPANAGLLFVPKCTACGGRRSVTGVPSPRCPSPLRFSEITETTHLGL